MLRGHGAFKSLLESKYVTVVSGVVSQPQVGFRWVSGHEAVDTDVQLYAVHRSDFKECFVRRQPVRDVWQVGRPIDHLEGTQGGRSDFPVWSFLYKGFVFG